MHLPLDPLGLTVLVVSTGLTLWGLVVYCQWLIRIAWIDRMSVEVAGCAGCAVLMIAGAAALFLMSAPMPWGSWQGPAIAFRYCVMAALMAYAVSVCRKQFSPPARASAVRTQVMVWAIVVVLGISLMVFAIGSGGKNDEGVIEPETISVFVRFRNASSIGLALLAACAYGVLLGIRDQAKNPPPDDDDGPEPRTTAPHWVDPETGEVLGEQVDDEEIGADGLTKQQRKNREKVGPIDF